MFAESAAMDEQQLCLYWNGDIRYCGYSGKPLSGFNIYILLF